MVTQESTPPDSAWTSEQSQVGLSIWGLLSSGPLSMSFYQAANNLSRLRQVLSRLGPQIPG